MRIGFRMAAWIIALAALAVAAGALAHSDAPGERAHAAPLAAAPPNDDWQFKSPLVPPMSPPGISALPFDLTQPAGDATLEPGEDASCAPITGSVWYELYADTSGTITVDTAGSNYDTVLAVYQAAVEFVPSPPGGGLAEIVCNDDAGGAQSRVAFGVVPGTSYYIQVASKGSSGGTLRIHAECDPACPPPNDNQASATYGWVDIYQPHWSTTVDTRAATLEPGETRPCADIGNTVWFTFFPNADMEFDITTAGSSFDTAVAVYGFMDPFTLPSPPGGIENIACEDDGAGAAALTVALKADTQYWFQAGGARGASGSLVFDLSCHGTCPPYNDRIGYAGFSTPPFIDGFDTSGATLEPDEPTSCGDMGKTVWWGVMAEGPTKVTVDTTGSDFPVAVAVYDNPTFDFTFDGLHELDCATDAGGDARAQFDAKVDQYYFIQVGGMDGASGNLSVSIDCTPGPCPPYGDSISRAYWTEVPWGYPMYDFKDTGGATLDDGEPTSCGNMAHTVWYRVWSPADVRMTYSTDDSTFDTAMAVYRVPGMDGVTPYNGIAQVACFAGGTGERAGGEFDVRGGETLFVQVGGRNGAGGELSVYADCVGGCPPANDSWLAPEWTYAPYQVYTRTNGATLDPDEPRPCGDIGKTVWYYVPPDQHQEFSVDTRNTLFDTVIAVYEQSGMSPPGGVVNIGCTTTDSFSFNPKPGVGYLVQIGGVGGASGDLVAWFDCGAGCGGQGGGGLIPSPGSIAGPDTGSGGYLHGARR